MFGVSQKSLQNLVLNDFYPRIIQDQAWDVKLVHNSAQVKDTSHKEQETKRCEAAFDAVILGLGPKGRRAGDPVFFGICSFLSN